VFEQRGDEIIANHIIELAQAGERDAWSLCDWPSPSFARVQINSNPRGPCCSAQATSGGAGVTRSAATWSLSRDLRGDCFTLWSILNREPLGGGSYDIQIADLLKPDDDDTALRDQVRRLPVGWNALAG
jgi:hypothetical protein